MFDGFSERPFLLLACVNENAEGFGVILLSFRKTNKQMNVFGCFCFYYSLFLYHYCRTFDLSSMSLPLTE